MTGRKRKKLPSNPNIVLGSYCKLNGIEEISDLKEGMDFRKPEYRREVFLRFYEFHLKYYSHPGGVYFIMPYLANEFNWTKEQKYWFAFINGCTQNPCTSWVIFNNFPNFEEITEAKLEEWHRKYWRRLDYDTDKRYSKGHFVDNFINYKKNLGGLTQTQFFEEGLAYSDDPYENFWRVWNIVLNDFLLFGRLSSFSYLEYLKLMGLNIDCPDLLLWDMEGSKSHRNGICKVLGRDDLDWYKDNTDFPGHSEEVVSWLAIEGEKLLIEAEDRFKDRKFFKDVNYFTLESALCTYKSHYRVNRRYPNVYMDMLYKRIKKAEKMGWEDHGINFDIFWEMRKSILPKYLRLEDNINDPTYSVDVLSPIKQNHFRLTGQMIMIDHEWSCFTNDFNKKYFS
jgi:hypothetical protein